MNEIILENKKINNKKEPLFKGFVIGFFSQAALMLTPLLLIYVLISGFIIASLVGFGTEFIVNWNNDKRMFNVANILANCAGGVLASVAMAAIISIGNLLGLFL